MKNIKFITIQLEGFSSFIKSTKFNLDRKGINLVKGNNGVGKTTLFNALYWCLYGENLKGLTNSKIATKKDYRDKEWRGTRVALTLLVDDVPFVIIRHLNFKGQTKGLEGGSKLIVIENGEMSTRELYKKDSQLFINDLIELDSKIFLNSILFGQRMKKFIEADPSEKRKIFESIFELDFIEDLKVKAQDKKKDFESSVTTILNKIKSLEESSNLLDSQIISNEKIVKTFEEDKKATLAELQIEINEADKSLAEEIKKLEPLKTKLDSLDLRELDSLKNSQMRLENDIEKISKDLKTKSRLSRDTSEEILESERRIEQYKRDVECIRDNCPTCEQNLPKKDIDKVKESILAKIENEKSVIKVQSNILQQTNNDEQTLQTELKSKQDSLSKILDNISSFKTLLEDKSKLETDISVSRNIIKNLEEKLNNLDARVDKEKAKKPPITKEELDKQIISYNLKLDEIDELKEKLEVINKDLERITWWIKEAFGANGLKSYIFNSMLTNLNTSIQKYASRLGFRIQFSIDMEKASKPFLTKCFDYKGVESDYEEFSGGEKARIDVSSAFAIHDLVSSNAKIDLLIMDEIFEGLDESGIEDVFDLIRLKSEGKSLYIITHSKSIDSLNSHNIELIKENNNTIIL